MLLIRFFTGFIFLSILSYSCKSEPEEKIDSPIVEVNPEERIRLDTSSISIAGRFLLGDNQIREIEKKDSFGWFLQNFPLLLWNSPVLLFDGAEKSNQSNHLGILDIDIGKRDLQQCADAAMRLRGEFLFSTGQIEKIAFNFLSDGKARKYTTYAGSDRSYSKFRKYMDYIFSYANTESLGNQLEKVSISDCKIGDVFIDVRPGRIGHAVVVVDMMRDTLSGDRFMMLAQSYMPAQSIHILRNPSDPESPWFRVDSLNPISTPEWVFSPRDLKRF